MMVTGATSPRRDVLQNISNGVGMGRSGQELLWGPERMSW